MENEKESSAEAVVTDTELEDDSEPTDEERNAGEEATREQEPLVNEQLEEEELLKEEDGEELKEECTLSPGFGPKIDAEESDRYPHYQRVFLQPETSCEEIKNVEIEPPPKKVKCRTKSKGEWKNPIRSEMHYYLSTLRLAVPKMTNEHDQMRLRRWIFYLLRNVTDKVLRNRYLLLVTISALSNECLDVVRAEPPSSLSICLPSLPSSCTKIQPARWESDIYWDRLVTDMPRTTVRCPLHNKCTPNAGLEEGIIEAVGGQLMDQEYKYFLYLIRPYVLKLNKSEDKVRASMWIQKLASIRPCSCAFMKGLRNDYMQAFLGYVSLGRCPGPFKRLPPEGPLLPLSMESKKYCDQPVLSELSQEAAQDFLSNLKPVENGAICYLALSGHPDNTKISFTPLDPDFNVDF